MSDNFFYIINILWSLKVDCISLFDLLDYHFNLTITDNSTLLNQ